MHRELEVLWMSNQQVLYCCYNGGDPLSVAARTISN